jgi:prefoldin subunit 5
LDSAQRELADVRNLLQLTESNAERDAADARSRIASVEHERNEARELAQRLRDDLEAQLSGLQASLAEANAIIAAVAAEGSGRWQRIGEALGFARPRQSSRALAAWEAASDAKSPISDSSNDTGKRESMTNAHAVAARNPYQRANSLAELLSWDDVDFVRCAYVTVLGRQPDSGGEAHYADRLRRGRPKTEVLWNLRRSPEARRHDPGIAGLDRALKRAHWKHYLLSAFVRSTGAAGAMPSSARGMREDLAEIEDQLTSLSSKIDQMQQSLAFIEGGLLKSTERDENLVPLDPDSFARRLAIAARNFESAAQ